MKKVDACTLSLKQVRWDELYDSEQELLESMMKCKTDANVYPTYQLVRGYEYIGSFQKQYSRKGSLTEKQLTQVKRLAKSIYAHLRGYKGVY